MTKFIEMPIYVYIILGISYYLIIKYYINKRINFLKKYDKPKLVNPEENKQLQIKNHYFGNIEFDKYKTKDLLNYNELKFYKMLNEFLNDKNLYLFSKVRIADFISVNKGKYEKGFLVLFNKISQKHIDYIITDYNGRIKVLIELDGNSHNTDYKTKENDNFKNILFKEIGMPLLRYKNNSFKDLNKICNYI